MNIKKNNAFTLVELLAVIGILGIIGLIATPIVLGIMEETKKDVFYTSVLSLVNATKMDIGNKYYEEEFTYTLEDGVIDNIEFPVSNAEEMYGMIEYDENSKVQYAVHNEKYCVKKMDYMNKAKIFNYEGICDFSTSEDCFEFSNGTITDYYKYEKNNKNNDICPRKVIIPGTINGQIVTKIDVSAFEKKELTGVEFPSTIKTIANYAFSNNKISGNLDLSHLTELTGLGYYSFQNNQIETIKFPTSSLTSIGSGTFQHNKLTGELDLSNLNKLEYIDLYAFQGASDGSTNQISSIKFPSSVKFIHISSFAHNKLSGELDLSHLTGLTGFGGDAFVGNSDGSTNQITSLKLPSSVTTINGFAHNKLSGELDLSHLTGLKTIGGGAFSGNSNGNTNQLTSLKIPSSVASIGGSAFESNKLSGELDLSHLVNMNKIENRAFAGNQLLQLKLPDSVTSIGDYAFENNKLTSIVLPSSLISTGRGVFQYNKLSGELDLSNLNSFTSIGVEAFRGNQLTSLKLPSSITYIGIRAFASNKLTTVTFYGRSDLTGISIDNSSWGWASGYNATNNIYFVNE